MILVIDNYDSFTYNLVQYLGELGEDIVVKRNDEIDLDGIAELAPDHILISPGPCTPNEAGVSLALIDRFKGRFRFLACVWDIRQSDKLLAGTSYVQSSLCMARRRRFCMMAVRSLRAFRLLTRLRDITP